MESIEGDGEAPEEARGEFKVHYYLQHGAHEMDATTRNRAENETLALLKELGKLLSVTYDLRTRAYGEGGLQEYLALLGQNKEQIGIVLTILGGVLSAPFYSGKLKQSRQQTAINELNLKKLQLEIQEKEAAAQAARAKERGLPLEGQPTAAEFAQAVLSTKKIARRRSNLYLILQSDSEVEAVGFAPTHQPGSEQIVRREEFGRYIIDLTEMEPEVHVAVPIEVVSPVLRDQSIKWRGLFQRRVISFDLADPDFRQKVREQRVQFQRGTVLVCDLEVLRRENEAGDPEVTGFVVTSVHDVRSATMTHDEEQADLGFDLPNPASE